MIFWASVFLPYPVLLQHNSGGLAVTVNTAVQAVGEQKVVGKKGAESPNHQRQGSDPVSGFHRDVECQREWA